MLSAYVLIQTEVGKVAHVGQAISDLDGVQLVEDVAGGGLARGRQRGAVVGRGLGDSAGVGSRCGVSLLAGSAVSA